jgi:hypothetical protein
MTNPKCPDCGSTKVSVVCKVWLNYGDGIPELDGEDGDYAEPYPEPGNNAICRHCEHTFIIR